jgi:hypothetical protein
MFLQKKSSKRNIGHLSNTTALKAYGFQHCCIEKLPYLWVMELLKAYGFQQSHNLYYTMELLKAYGFQQSHSYYCVF